MNYKILEYDKNLVPFAKDIDLRMENLTRKKEQLLKPGQTLADFANGYEYFGFHKTKDGWYYREWAPAAEQMYLTGDFNGWSEESCPMRRLENGVFEVVLDGKDALQAGQKVQAIVVHQGQWLRRIP